MALEFSPETWRRFEELVGRYPKKEAALIPVLSMAQKEFGHLRLQAMEYVAKIIELPAARVYSVVSFYTMLNMKPVGKYHIQVCRTLPCALMGAERMAARLKRKLGIQVGETTSDGNFTLTEVECLASCGTAPMMQVNEDYYENLTEAKVDDVLESLK
ncbi:MAG: NADH-quinone oxidoreductase subunit NuoE [Deltaproteobacteria bacterium]|nr:MAG: NADH-quinone oxidoreductase subunit NuoE [Deltaproteobacteria bacterium]